jgi:F-type H+-transporting ATPase subunit b
MLIDWFTVGAQGVNFLILVWLLRRFLYKPVLGAIDAREKSIAAKLGDATAREAKAHAAGEELRKRNEAFDRQREELLRKATNEAATERQRLIESARQDSQLLRVKLAKALADERAELCHQLSIQTQAEVFAVARKMLADLSGASLEDRMIEVFIARLQGLPEKQRLVLASEGMGTSAGVDVGTSAAPGRVALVRSAFELPPAGRAKVEAAIRESLGANVATRFETSPEFVCGVELTVDGMKLAWSVADYLSSLAQDATALAATELSLSTASAAPLTPVAKEAVHAR